MSGIGTAVSDVFGAIGDFQEAGGYDTAASYATQEAQYVKLSTQIQEQQSQRQMYQVVGATESDAAANSGAISGSALDTLHSNVMEATKQKSLIALQGGITEAGYNAQAAADRAMASAANTAGVGGILGAVGSIFGL